MTKMRWGRGWGLGVGGGGYEPWGARGQGDAKEGKGGPMTKMRRGWGWGRGVRDA